MVIQQFNKLIRNKLVWGVFAIAVSLFFAFGFIADYMGGERTEKNSAGTIGGEPVSAERFQAARLEVTGNGRDNGADADINAKVWNRVVDADVAAKNGIVAGDALVRSSINAMFGGSADYNEYRMRLAQNGLTPERFEAGLRSDLEINEGLIGGLVASGAFVSPMELDIAVADLTDKLTIRVARFKQSKEAADAVKVDDAALKAWYEKNLKSLALPELIKVKSARFDASKPETLAIVSVTDDEMHDWYDANSDKYTSTDTNGVETVKKFEDVKADIEKELRKIAAVEYLTTNLQRRVYANLAAGEDEKSSRLEKIAVEDGVQVKTSDWFSTESDFVEGFMVRNSTICPNARDFIDRVAELDSESPDFRYAVVASDNAVWILEKVETSPAHTPSFDEAKGKIDARALRDAKADAFKAEVDAIAAKGKDAVLATADVSTNIVFSAFELAPNTIPDQARIVEAARKLKAGAISDFVSTGTGRGALVVCESREAGDPALALNLRDGLRRRLAMNATREIADDWREDIYRRADVKPAVGYETAAADDTAAEEE